ncbi:MAG: hypothetical protein ACPIB0_09240 [Akkermansiaceae bacterium]
MNFSPLPSSFYISLLGLVIFSLYAWKHRREGWGLPMLAVLGTVAVWYHGDGLYNDYELYKMQIDEGSLNAAWWQILLFVVTFGLLVPPIHRAVNEPLLGRRSTLMLYTETPRIKHPAVQHQIDQLGKALLVAWLILMAIALYRTNFNFGGIFMPYLEGIKSKMWARSRVGGGISALLSLGSYLQILLTASFGVLAAVSKNPKTRIMAITICCLAFPYYIFDRTRNAMIATLLPGLLAWVFLSLQGRVWKKVVILVLAFLMFDFWFILVTKTNMGRSVSIANALEMYEEEKKLKAELAELGEEYNQDERHVGLNMFHELAYIDDFIDNGTYSPNWGKRYFAEAVNVIPRGLWKNKPLVGVDYAIVRGFASKEGTNQSGAGITASIATGMIGQGVTNFGRLLGPMAAALLMSIWVAVLARQDLMGDKPARLLLCVVGMILTFNMGRDITLFVLYPFVFGYMLVLGYEWWKKRQITTAMPSAGRDQKNGSPKQGGF